MARNNYFQFKQFRIEQQRSAMKVGVDGVLLGAWTDVGKAKNILDVGTGTGLIALMLAQRSGAKTTAIEIEKKAADEATANVAASPWKERIHVQHISYQEFAAKNNEKFDLIVSNPPYFSNGYKAANNERTLARHNDKLSLTELITNATGMLDEDGRIALILPISELENVLKITAENGIYLQRFTEIKPKPVKSANRILVQFSRKNSIVQKSSLTIYGDDNSFAEAYRELTRDFYLKF